MYRQHSKSNLSVYCDDHTALEKAMATTVEDGVLGDKTNILLNEHYNIYERGLRALRSKEEKCAIIKNKME